MEYNCVVVGGGGDRWCRASIRRCESGSRQGVKGGRSARFFLSFVKSPNFFAGPKKSVKKKQDMCEEKHGTAYFFSLFLLLLPAFVPHMSGGFGHMVALEGPPANQREGGRSPGSRRQN